MITEIKRSDLPALLSPFAGGYFFGLLMIHEQLHALIAAPHAEGDFADVPWGEFGKDITGATSFNDGLANTEAMAATGSELAQKIRALRIGGFDDWHLPARDQLELLYRHGKPTTEKNWVFRNGDNPSSVPAGFPYTATLPAQCADELFQAGGAEAFADNWYWSSTQSSARLAWFQHFDGGYQTYYNKAFGGRARAVRTIPVIN